LVGLYFSLLNLFVVPRVDLLHQVVSSALIKGYIQGGQPLKRRCLLACTGQAKMNEAFPYKLVASRMRMLLTFSLALPLLNASQHDDHIFLLLLEMQQKLRIQLFI
jgi:hypothetical protein